MAAYLSIFILCILTGPTLANTAEQVVVIPPPPSHNRVNVEVRKNIPPPPGRKIQSEPVQQDEAEKVVEPKPSKPTIEPIAQPQPQPQPNGSAQPNESAQTELPAPAKPSKPFRANVESNGSKPKAKSPESLKRKTANSVARSEKQQKPKGKKLKSGFYRPKKSCSIRSKPSTKSKTLGEVKARRKIWVDGESAQWSKIYRKSGPGYVSNDCLK